MPSAFVTGGSGFIGGRLISRLVADGTDVRALARSEASAAKVAGLGAAPVRGDLADTDAMAAGAQGCEHAYHLAAHLGDYGDWAEFERGNVDGTRNALDACARAGVRRFVHCGTEAALMAGEPLIEVDESAPLRPDSPAPYPATKAQAEQTVRAANREGFETVVLRPRFVWGLGDTTLLPQMVEMVKAGKFMWVGGGGQLTATTQVDNVVEGLVLAAERGSPGEAYFVTDGEPKSEPVVFREFVSDLLRTQGVEPPTRTIPGWVGGVLRAVGEPTWKALPLPGRPPLARFTLWVLTQECTIDDSKARRELGYSPVVSRAQGLEELREGARTSAAA
jgi:nucleoside-diphosphate-sugar epimerase